MSFASHPCHLRHILVICVTSLSFASHLGHLRHILVNCITCHLHHILVICVTSLSFASHPGPISHKGPSLVVSGRPGQVDAQPPPQITPVSSFDDWKAVDWYSYLHILGTLSAANARVWKLIGVDESFIIRMAGRGVNSKTRSSAKFARLLNVHTRYKGGENVAVGKSHPYSRLIVNCFDAGT